MPDISPDGYKRLPSSTPRANAHATGPINPHELVEVSIYLRARATNTLSKVVIEGGQLPGEQYVETHGASPEDMAAVEQFAHEHGLTIVEKNAVARKIVLAGSAATMNSVFATDLQYYETSEGGRYKGHTGPLHIPGNLDEIVKGVFGLDNF